MTEWRVLTLGELAERPGCEIRTGPFGSQLHMSDYEDQGIPVVMPKDMIDGRLNYRSVAKISEQKASELAAHVTRAGDVLIARRGDIGRSILIREPDAGVLCGTGSLRVSIQESELVPEFLFQYLSTDLGRHQLASKAVGATMPNISGSIVRSMEIRFPSKATQRLIVAILASYDELIENNARRIEILEEMAQAIYREWFVEFRYPGHEGVPLVDSELGPIPEGWGVTTVDAAFEISGGGTPSKTVTEYWENGDIDWYTPTDLTATRSMFMSESKSKITRLGLEKSSAKLFPAGSVMMTSRATIGVVSISETEASTNQGFITCIPNDRYSALFIVQWLRASADVIDSLASGATFKEINKKNFREIKLVAPSEIALSEFQKIVAPICDSIAVLLKSNRNLRETRDLLLPKLISGEIDVSDLDIELADSVA